MSTTKAQELQVSGVISQLARAIIRDNPVRLMALCREQLRFICLTGADETYCETLKAIYLYFQRIGKCPDSLETLRQWIEVTSNEERAETPEDRKDFKLSEETVYIEVDALKAENDEVPTDVEMLMKTAAEKARRLFYWGTFTTARLMALGVKDAPDAKDQTGIEAAQAYVARQRRKDPVGQLNILQGGWVENADEISALLDNHLERSEEERIYTGFREIDASCLIGKKFLKWIGVLGFTNHGKSTFLLPLAYNMARAGHKILYVPCEGSPEDVWTRLTWIHNEFLGLPLCTRNTWLTTPKLVTQRDRQTKDRIIDDLKNRRSIKGGIDVAVCRTWEQIMDHLEANKAQWNYDVLIVDYIGHLAVEGKDPHKAKLEVFRKAQMLTHNHNGGEGIVCITPLQANRKGMEEANEREDDVENGILEWGCYADTTSVDWYSGAAQDMDLVIGVWGHSALATKNLMRVHCVKARGTNHFKAFDAYRNPSTEYVKDGKGKTEQVIFDNYDEL